MATQEAPSQPNLAVVPSKEGSVQVRNESGEIRQKFANVTDAITFFDQVTPDTTVVTPMGGPGQSLFSRLSLTHQVMQVPWFTLEDIIGDVVGSEADDRAHSLLAAFALKPEAFYPMSIVSRDIVTLRELARVRARIQRYFRIPGQQIYAAAERDFEAMLPDDQRFIKLRQTFANLQMAEAAKRDEEHLEREINKLLKGLTIYDALRDHDFLPAVKGFGPAIAGTIIGEIGDIRRFPAPAALRAYARMHVDKGGAMPRRHRGEVANWNSYLFQAVWLWYSDQLPRYDHVWRDLYYVRKAHELRAHPETVQVPSKSDPTKMVNRYNLGHLDIRAKRNIGSQLLIYTWGLWTVIEASGNDAEAIRAWYTTPTTTQASGQSFTRPSWSELFGRARNDSAEAKAFAESERDRRRGEPTGKGDDDTPLGEVLDLD